HQSPCKGLLIEIVVYLKGGDCSRLRYFGTLYVFTLSQKKESGGYGAAVVYES
ncbi:hypothetical protein HMPREF1988_00380, partial [Porphyromonas gingivalis F0185]